MEVKVGEQKVVSDFKNARQIPKIQRICADKRYHDILYSYLQENSEWDGINGNPRYVEKNVVNFSKIGSELGISRQTVSTRFKHLVQLGLVSDLNDGKYYLSILPAEVAALIPTQTLRLLLNTLSDNAISTYIYLLLRYYANKEKSFTFQLSDVKKYIGICANTRSNDDIITNILFVLQKIGLIKYSLTTAQSRNNMEYDDVRTIYQIDFLTNYIEGI